MDFSLYFLGWDVSRPCIFFVHTESSFSSILNLTFPSLLSSLQSSFCFFKNVIHVACTFSFLYFSLSPPSLAHLTLTMWGNKRHDKHHLTLSTHIPALPACLLEQRRCFTSRIISLFSFISTLSFAYSLHIFIKP